MIFGTIQTGISAEENPSDVSLEKAEAAENISLPEEQLAQNAPALLQSDYVCAHPVLGTDSSGKTVCESCRASLDVKIEKDGAVTYGTDINAAIKNAEDGSTLTLLNTPLRIEINLYVPSGVTFTLDLNGKSLMGYALRIDDADSHLTVIDTKGNGQIGFYIWDGTVEFKPKDATTTISDLGVYGGDVKLYGGNIKNGNWQFSDSGKINFTHLLPQGYAYAQYLGRVIDWIKLADLNTPRYTGRFDLSVQKCPHPGTADICEYCGAHTVLKVTKNGTESHYTELNADAIEAANGGTLTLLGDITTTDTFVVENNKLTLDLNGHKLTHNSPDRLFDLKNGADLTVVDSSESAAGEIYSEGYAFYTSGNAIFTVNGGKFAGTIVTPGNDSVTDSYALYAESGTVRITDGTFENFFYIEDRRNEGKEPQVNARLSGGRFFHFRIKGADPATALADGYAFTLSNTGITISGYGDSPKYTGAYHLVEVTVSEHTHSFSSTTHKCACGAACTHENVDSSSWECTACGELAAARVTNWDETDPKWYFGIDDAFTSAAAGEYKMIVLRTGEYTFSDDIPVFGNIICHFADSGISTNIVKFNGGHSFVVKSGGSLGLGDNMHIGAATVETGGSFGLQSNATIDHLILKDGCRTFTDAKLQHGNFGKITVPVGRSVKDTVWQSNDTECSFKHIGGTWATQAELSANEIENVNVASLPFSYPNIAINLKGANKIELNGKIEQSFGAYNGQNLLDLSIEKKDGNITDYKWVIDYYAPGSETVTETKDSAAETLSDYHLDKVGTYKIRCTIAADGYSKSLTGKDIVITKATASCTAPTANALTYNGAEQALVTAGSTEDGTMMYSLDGKNWSETIPTAAAAKTYTVYYKVAGDENHNDSSAESVEVTIAPYKISGISAVIEKIYDGKTTLPRDFSLSFTDAANPETNVSLWKNVDYTLNDCKYTTAAAGDDIDVTLNIKLNNSNYAFTDGTGTAFEKQFTVKGKIKKAEAPDALGELAIVKGVVRNYTLDLKTVLGALPEGCTYGDIIFGTPIVDIPDGDIGTARIDGDTLTLPVNSYGPTLPSTAGLISIPVTAANYESFTMTVTVEAVNKIYPEGAPTLSNTVIRYGEKLSKIALSGSLRDNTQKIDVAGTFRWVSPDETPHAGPYKAEWIFEPNDYRYETTYGKADITVEKADSVCTAPTANTLTYNGAEQALVAAGSTNDGTMMYSLDKKTWSNTVPTAEKAGNYTVYYKVAGDDDHNDSDENQVKVSISKLPVIIAWDDTENLSYDNTQKIITAKVSNKFGDDAITLTKSGIFAATESGNYTAEITGIDNTNYTLEGGLNLTKNWSIAKKDITGATIGSFDLTYNGKEQTPTATVTIDGLTATGTWSAVTNVSDKTAFTANGNFSGTIADVETQMNKKDISGATVTPGNTLTYNGSEQTQDVDITLDDLTVTYGISGNKATNVKTDGNYTLTVTGSGNFEGSKDLDWNIAPAEPFENNEKKTTATVRRGRPLSDADVTNGELLGVDKTTVLKGTFAWADSKKVINSNSTEQMIFTPEDKNYCDITLDVAVSAYSSNGDGSVVSTFTVKFETNGANEIKSQSVRRNSTAAEPETPKKNGFKFAGWFTDPELTNKYDFTSRVTRSFTLYAAWAEIEPDSEPTNPDAPNPFDDISKDDWYYEDVINVFEEGLFTGTDNNRFSPKANITRGMFVTVLYRLEGEPAVNRSIPFEDVSADSYYANAVIWAQQNGIIKGFSEKEFAPNKNITREQIAAMMFRFAQYKGYDVTQGGMQIREFDDFENISDYAIAAMTWAVNTGLMRGKTQTTINPQDNATRAEIAAIFSRFLKANK